MNCPYCGKEMQQGVVCQADTWQPGDGEWLMGKEKEFVRLRTWKNPKPEGHFCADCRIIVMPVPEKTEDPLDALKEKWKKLRGDVEEKYDDYKTAQEEERNRKKKEKQRKKDPWEV